VAGEVFGGSFRLRFTVVDVVCMNALVGRKAKLKTTCRQLDACISCRTDTKAHQARLPVATQPHGDAALPTFSGGFCLISCIGDSPFSTNRVCEIVLNGCHQCHENLWLTLAAAG
jgi:hypothetical protein